ncbi:MAG TPA: ABC transporter ATP-binding protein [Conexibacter sp.]|nr:ABC transporter ATP-binding protein [Conexibacter sp.]
MSLTDVGMTFGGAGVQTQAIASITADVGRGRFVSVIGPSGCGKSTLLDLVCGLQRPTAGSVRVGGEPVKGPRRDTAMVFQEDSTLHWRTVLENAAFGLEVAGVGKRERERRAQEMLELVGLDGFEQHRPRQLSGGMKQRVAIARALVMHPEILLMDEPFGALDQQTRWLVGQELTRIWERARTSVLFVTHDIQEAVLLSDEVWVLSRRPSHLKRIVEIDLPRPRSADVTKDPRFHELTTELWDLLSVEVDVARVLAGGSA